MSWVTNSAVLRARRQIDCNSSCRSSRVCESNAPNGSSISMPSGSSAHSRPSVQADIAGRGRLEAPDDVQEGALAAAGRSDDGYEFMLLDRERQTIDGSDGAPLSGERLVEVADLQQGHRRAFSTNTLQRA